MNNSKKNISAFTLAETLIVILVVAIISLTTIAITKTQINFAEQMAAYATVKNMQSIITELIATSGAGKQLPAKGYVGDGTGLCEKIVHIVNTMGTVDCTTNVTTGFTNANKNFKLSNASMFYNLGADPDANGTFTIFVDIDGSNRGKSVLDTDVLKFMITKTGDVVLDSAAATNKSLISASVKYEDYTSGARKIGYVANSVTFKEAVCKMGFTQDDPVNGPIYCAGYSTDLKCPATPSSTCQLVINMP